MLAIVCCVLCIIGMAPATFEPCIQYIQYILAVATKKIVERIVLI